MSESSSKSAHTHDELKTLPIAEIEMKLGASPEGLTAFEATKRLTHDEQNEIEEKKPNEILKSLGYFWGPILRMIEVTVIRSGVVGHWLDFFIIGVLLVVNAVVGYWEEHSAGKAIAALKAKLATKTRVRRDGQWITPPARELVLGDVILANRCPPRARLATRCFLGRSFGAFKAAH